MKKSLIALALILVLGLTGCSALDALKISKVLKPEEAKAKAEKFINEYLVQPGSEVTVTAITEDKGLYKLTVKLASGDSIDSFISKDGVNFYPQAYDIVKIEAEKNGDADPTGNTTAGREIPKSDKPIVEVFVMSHCPYGTQIEKGILPVKELLGDKIDLQVKFCDYVMHGKQEIDEQLNQYCIQTEQNDKFLSYLKCFLTAGNGAECLKSEGIDESQMKNCVAKADSRYKVTENYNDQSTWLSGQYPLFDVYADDNDKYGVQGSPTLIVNGVEASSGRDSAGLLQTICMAFNNQPEECNAQLPSTPPSAGFGFEATGSDSSASCGG